jgi:hypothetical protein
MNPIAANLKVKAGRRQQPLKPGNNFHDKSGQDRNRNRWSRTIGSVVAACSLGEMALMWINQSRINAAYVSTACAGFRRLRYIPASISASSALASVSVRCCFNTSRTTA